MEETGDSTIIDNFKTINMTYLIGDMILADKQVPAQEWFKATAGF